MTTIHATFSSSQTNMELVAPQLGKIIRVTRVLLTSWAAMKMTLLSDPGPDPQALTPALHVSSGSNIALDLGPREALVTGRGKALGFTAAFQGSAAEYSLMVWYELVD